MKLKAMLSTAFVLIVLSFVVLGSCAAPDLGLGAGGELKACPDSPNCVCSEGDGGEDSFISGFEIPAGVEPQGAFEALAGLVDGDADTVTRDAGYLHAVYKTRILRFRDDFEARLDGEAPLIHVRSASRLGYSDMGVNRRRVEGLRSRWAALVEPVAGTSVDGTPAAGPAAGPPAGPPVLGPPESGSTDQDDR